MSADFNEGLSQQCILDGTMYDDVADWRRQVNVVRAGIVDVHRDAHKTVQDKLLEARGHLEDELRQRGSLNHVTCAEADVVETDFQTDVEIDGIELQPQATAQANELQEQGTRGGQQPQSAAVTSPDSGNPPQVGASGERHSPGPYD
ncbi:hypothetical protein DOTSEDRAFT_34170 [Dothistroma septosporum NZE10]|uniref:Uncharacterized protein n=1 Tax=Dothistroma septosporum (strain NZE10 / CBS 128990) TaxID=675120 RepID=N1PQI4_DOTSN|nr:hypothetical protein DOTSEDRAFT_34170 [Dothistroma septosporum NZE10]